MAPSFFFDWKQPKWEGHQLDLNKNFPQEWGLLVTGRRWGPPSPSALIAKMSGGQRRGLGGWCPSPSQPMSPPGAQSVPHPDQDYPPRSRPPHMTSLPAGLKICPCEGTRFLQPLHLTACPGPGHPENPVPPSTKVSGCREWQRGQRRAQRARGQQGQWLG